MLLQEVCHLDWERDTQSCFHGPRP